MEFPPPCAVYFCHLLLLPSFGNPLKTPLKIFCFPFLSRGIYPPWCIHFQKCMKPAPPQFFGLHWGIYLSYLLTFYLAYLSGILSGMASDILSGICSGILSWISSDSLSGTLSGRSSDIFSSRLKSGEAHSAQTLAGCSPTRPRALRLSPVEVRRGPQRSDSRRLKSGEAHSDRALAVGVWQGPLRSRAGSGGPARPTAIESWQWRSREAHCDRELAVEVWRGGRKGEMTTSRRSRASDIKSNNPHLTGGEFEGSPISGNHHFMISHPKGQFRGITFRSGILSGISSDILSGRSCVILCDILSGISSDILSSISSDILSGISSNILSAIHWLKLKTEEMKKNIAERALRNSHVLKRTRQPRVAEAMIF